MKRQLVTLVLVLVLILGLPIVVAIGFLAIGLFVESDTRR